MMASSHDAVLKRWPVAGQFENGPAVRLEDRLTADQHKMLAELGFDVVRKNAVEPEVVDPTLRASVELEKGCRVVKIRSRVGAMVVVSTITDTAQGWVATRLQPEHSGCWQRLVDEATAPRPEAPTERETA